MAVNLSDQETNLQNNFCNFSGNTELQRFNQRKRDALSRGQEVIDLSMINPDMPPPRVIMDKLVEAAVRPQLHRYSVARGVARLRSAFAEKYKSVFDVELDPEKNICVTFGSKDAILNTLMCFNPALRKQKKVLLGTPVYPAYCSAAELAGFEFALFQIQDDEQQMLSSIKAACEKDPIGILLLNFPNNPTGINVSAEFWKDLTEFCSANNIFVINDFVYGELVYSGVASSLLSVKREGVAEVYSLSKGYCIPGWRVGALLGDSQVVSSLAGLKAQVDYGLFLPLQHAAAEALLEKNSYAREVSNKYAQRVSRLSTGLQKAGFIVSTPSAGCCIWLELPEHMNSNAVEFSNRLLDQEGVAVLPGTAFGDAYQYKLRLALVQDEGRLNSVLHAFERTVDSFAASHLERVNE